jgi:hypothetical protein
MKEVGDIAGLLRKAKRKLPLIVVGKPSESLADRIHGAPATDAVPTSKGDALWHCFHADRLQEMESGLHPLHPQSRFNRPCERFY